MKAEKKKFLETMRQRYERRREVEVCDCLKHALDALEQDDALGFDLWVTATAALLLEMGCRSDAGHLDDLLTIEQPAVV